MNWFFQLVAVVDVLCGAAVRPREPGQSLLLRALTADRAELMPPKKALSTAVIADLREWIAMGAPDPRSEGAVKAEG